MRKTKKMIQEELDRHRSEIKRKTRVIAPQPVKVYELKKHNCVVRKKVEEPEKKSKKSHLSLMAPGKTVDKLKAKGAVVPPGCTNRQARDISQALRITKVLGGVDRLDHTVTRRACKTLARLRVYIDESYTNKMAYELCIKKGFAVDLPTC